MVYFGLVDCLACYVVLKKLWCCYLNVHLDFCVLTSGLMQSAWLTLVEKISF